MNMGIGVVRMVGMSCGKTAMKNEEDAGFRMKNAEHPHAKMAEHPDDSYKARLNVRA